MGAGLRSWIREPLLHFALVGAMLFGVYDALDRDADEPRSVVRITGTDLEWLRSSWTRQHQRPPDDRELRHLVSDYVREELLAREARALGLDEDDTVVRRRLAQKMEFLLEDAVRLAGPTEAELRRRYDRDRSRYRSAARISFTQIFFSSETDAERGLGALAAGSIDELGEPTLLAREYPGVDEPTVTNLFGRAFAEAVLGLDGGTWRGPFRSAYGFHLVRVTDRDVEAPLSFEAARERVREDWIRDQKSDADELLLRSLLAKYELVVEEAVEPWFGPLASAE